jgi:hypothetical protein
MSPISLIHYFFASDMSFYVVKVGKLNFDEWWCTFYIFCPDNKNCQCFRQVFLYYFWTFNSTKLFKPVSKKAVVFWLVVLDWFWKCCIFWNLQIIKKSLLPIIGDIFAFFFFLSCWAFFDSSSFILLYLSFCDDRRSKFESKQQCFRSRT